MPATRCGLCGRLLMLPSPVPHAVRCALCEVAAPHDAAHAASERDERSPSEVS